MESNTWANCDKGYHSLYEPIGEGVKADTESTIEYQEVEGMELPNKLVIIGMLCNQAIAAEVSFDEYVLNLRVTRNKVD